MNLVILAIAESYLNTVASRVASESNVATFVDDSFVSLTKIVVEF